MIYTAEISDTDKEKQWNDFEKTGSISSYLSYKGINITEDKNKTEQDSSRRHDGWR